jgi:acetolactate synthase-1/2/3 large subunit
MALGAAIACPDRPVIGIQADGSAMYTISALWSYARERAGQLLDLGGPNLDFVALATGMGVPATRATTAEELADQLRRALAEPGPHLIDAVLTQDG